MAEHLVILENVFKSSKRFQKFFLIYIYIYIYFLVQGLNFSPGSISLESQLDEFEEMQSQVISIAYNCLLEYYLWKCNLDLHLYRFGYKDHDEYK